MSIASFSSSYEDVICLPLRRNVTIGVGWSAERSAAAAAAADVDIHG